MEKAAGALQNECANLRSTFEYSTKILTSLSWLKIMLSTILLVHTSTSNCTNWHLMIVFRSVTKQEIATFFKHVYLRCFWCLRCFWSWLVLNTLLHNAPMLQVLPFWKKSTIVVQQKSESCLCTSWQTLVFVLKTVESFVSNGVSKYSCCVRSVRPNRPHNRVDYNCLRQQHWSKAWFWGVELRSLDQKYAKLGRKTVYTWYWKKINKPMVQRYFLPGFKFYWNNFQSMKIIWNRYRYLIPAHSV